VTWTGNAGDGQFDFLTDTGYPGVCLDNVGKGEDWMTIFVGTQVGWPGAPWELEKRLWWLPVSLVELVLSAS